MRKNHFFLHDRPVFADISGTDIRSAGMEFPGCGYTPGRRVHDFLLKSINAGCTSWMIS
jgi:hypothetical protein